MIDFPPSTPSRRHTPSHRHTASPGHRLTGTPPHLHCLGTVRSNNGLGKNGKGRPCAERVESTWMAASVTEDGERRVYVKNMADVVAIMKKTRR